MADSDLLRMNASWVAACNTASDGKNIGPRERFAAILLIGAHDLY